MSRLNRIGIITILVGTFIPSILYPFASLTTSATLMQVTLGSHGCIYHPRLNELEIVLKKGNLIKDVNPQGRYDGRIAIRYNYTLAIGITLFYAGIIIMMMAINKNKPVHD
jgi:hypothetical protein